MSRQVFRSPRRWADVAMFAVLLPIALAAATFLIAIPVVGLLKWLGIELEDSTFITWCAIASVPLLAIGARRTFFLSITLEDDAIRLGEVWPRRVRYDRVRFIKSGADFGTDRDEHGKVAVTPLSFATGWVREYRLFLRREDAARAVRELHARCPNASALDADGQFFAPRNSGARGVSYGEYRAVRSLAIRATVAAVLSSLDLLSLLPRSGDGENGHRYWLLIPLLVVFLGYVVYAFRRIRQIVS